MTRFQSPGAAAARRRGTALLEVMVSLVLLGTAGAALVTLMGQSEHSLRHVRQTEVDVRRASDELARFAAYDRTTIVALIGQSMSRGWLVSVAQRAPDLFDVIVADTMTKTPILRTTLYRPDTIDAVAP